MSKPRNTQETLVLLFRIVCRSTIQTHNMLGRPFLHLCFTELTDDLSEASSCEVICFFKWIM